MKKILILIFLTLNAYFYCLIRNSYNLQLHIAESIYKIDDGVCNDYKALITSSNYLDDHQYIDFFTFNIAVARVFRNE